MADGATRPHQLVEILVGDHASAWAAAGFAVDGDSTVIDGVIVRLIGPDDGRGIRSIGIEGVDADLDGLATHSAPSRALADPTHPNGITEIDHLVVMTGDPDRTTSALQAAGIEARRVRVFGAEGKQTRQTFFWLGDIILELVGPDTGGNDDPAHAWGLALTAPDLDATATALGDALTPPKDAVQPGRRIATIKTRDLDVTTALAVMSPHPS